MADFQTCYEWFLPHEAGTPPKYAVTADNKGQVCAGINSLAFPADFAAIAALPIEQRPIAVEAFYRRNFWSTYCDQISSNDIAAYLLDSRVNQGPGTGVEILQKAVNIVPTPGAVIIATDGGLGPRTAAAVNTRDPVVLLRVFQGAREAAYRAIGGPNLPAWLARAALLPNLD